MSWMVGVFLVGMTLALAVLLAALFGEARRGQEESDRMADDLAQQRGDQ